MHTNTFDIYWLGQKDMYGLSNDAIKRLKADLTVIDDIPFPQSVELDSTGRPGCGHTMEKLISHGAIPEFAVESDIDEGDNAVQNPNPTKRKGPVHKKPARKEDAPVSTPSSGKKDNPGTNEVNDGDATIPENATGAGTAVIGNTSSSRKAEASTASRKRKTTGSGDDGANKKRENPTQNEVSTGEEQDTNGKAGEKGKGRGRAKGKISNTGTGRKKREPKKVTPPTPENEYAPIPGRGKQPPYFPKG